MGDFSDFLIASAREAAALRLVNVGVLKMLDVAMFTPPQLTSNTLAEKIFFMRRQED